MPAKAEEYARPAAAPDTSSLVEMREASRECTACHLYKRATQTVFGEGPKSAAIMLVGEQPGELRLVKPKLPVCLGATAAQAIFGPSFRVTRERGKVLSSKFAPSVLATVHPSSLLRQPDEESRQREYERFVIDLRAALKAAGEE